MSHNLWVEQGRAHMMFVGELPWHGLGTRLAAPATSAEAIKAAGLDWTVRRVPLRAVEGDRSVPVPGYDALVPADRWGQPDCPVFGVAGDNYRPLQNAEAFAFFDSIVGEQVAMYHTAGALDHGKRIWILAKLPGTMAVTDADLLEKHVLLSTGHDGRSAVRVTLTPVRVVCQNTLTLALASGREIARAYHTRNLGRRLQVVRENVQRLLAGFDHMGTVFRAMLGHKVSAEEVQAYLEAVFPVSERLAEQAVPQWVLQGRANCLRLFQDGVGSDDPAVRGTLWAAYNGGTEYVDHWHGRDRQRRMYDVLLGNGYRIKAHAFRMAAAMAGAASAL